MRVACFAAFLLVLVSISFAVPAPAVSADNLPGKWEHSIVSQPDESTRQLESKPAENTSILESSDRQLENEKLVGEASNKLLTEESVAETAGNQEQQVSDAQISVAETADRQLDPRADSVADKNITDTEEDADPSGKQVTNEASSPGEDEELVDTSDKQLDNESSSPGEGKELVADTSDKQLETEGNSDKELESDIPREDNEESVLDSTDKQQENEQSVADVTAEIKTADVSGESSGQVGVDSGVASDEYVPDSERSVSINGQQIVAHEASIDAATADNQVAANGGAFAENVERNEASDSDDSLDKDISSEDVEDIAERQTVVTEDGDDILDEQAGSDADHASGQEVTASEDEGLEDDDGIDGEDLASGQTQDELPKSGSEDTAHTALDSITSQGEVPDTVSTVVHSEENPDSDVPSHQHSAGMAVSEHSVSDAEAPSGGIVSQSEEDEPQHVHSADSQDDSDSEFAVGDDSSEQVASSDGNEDAEGKGLGVFAAYAKDKEAVEKEKAEGHAGVRSVEKTEEDPAQLQEELAERRRALAKDSGHVWRNPPQHLYTGHTYRPPQHGNNTVTSSTNAVAEQMSHNKEKEAPPPPAAVHVEAKEETFVQDVVAPGEEEEEEEQQPAPVRVDIRQAPLEAEQPHSQTHELNTIHSRRIMEPDVKSSQLFQFLFALAVIVAAARIGYSWFTMDKNRRIFLRKLRAPTERDVEV